MTRRDWLQRLGSISLLSWVACGNNKQPVILVCSGWQTANIGDIAHTPGLLALLRDHIPEAHIILWPAHVLDRGVNGMLLRAFPGLEVVTGELDDPATSPALEDAFRRSDLLIHGSGPSVVGERQLMQWTERTGKPFGIFGVTIQSINDTLAELLGKASFVYTRETHSLENLNNLGLTGPETGFAPDATFAFDIRDDAAAGNAIDSFDLGAGPLLCVVPRLRRTPYYTIYPERGWTDQQISEIDALNDRYKEQDHEKLRVALSRWIEQTDGWVLVCPEMTYQLDIMAPLVIDPLPKHIRSRVRPFDRYWLPDEAASVYQRAAAVLSMECHSPILSSAGGTPGLYLRHPTDTIKGQMWYDLGLSDWVFEIDDVSGSAVAEGLLKTTINHSYTEGYLQHAVQLADRLHKDAMRVVRTSAGL